jgi:hypothetical protein
MCSYDVASLSIETSRIFFLPENKLPRLISLEFRLLNFKGKQVGVCMLITKYKGSEKEPSALPDAFRRLQIRKS